MLNNNVINTTLTSAQDICALPMDRGDCDNYRLMFYFNSEQNECKHFFYGGCKGNANNFEKIEDCEKVCFKYLGSGQKSFPQLPTHQESSSGPNYSDFYFNYYTTDSVYREAEESAPENFSDALDKARKEQDQKHRQLLHTNALLLPLQARYDAKNNLLNVKQRIHSRAVAAITKAVASYSDAMSEHLIARDLAREHSYTRADAHYRAIANAKSAVLSAKMRLLTVYLENEKRASTAMSSALTKLHDARDALNQAKSDRDRASIEFENSVRHTQKLLQTDPTKNVIPYSISHVNGISGGYREMDGSGEEI
ncbi:kunitz/Bovine pancreatic trypsin inhibitor domain-containing protein [Ditylenchus destructor]|nr:kunitz/Bovine pancreatic trypsin inhibitor domain-containing protein [Ditylenchus destructor]